MRTTKLLLSGCLATVFAQAQQPAYFEDSAQRIEKIKATQTVVDNIFKNYAGTRFPGFVYGVVADGELVYTGSTGFTDLEKKEAANAASVFRIASMTKSFTAMAIMRLRDEGKLQLDDAASKYIPEMKGLKYLTTDAPVITIRRLLNHMAGFPEDNPWGDRQLADTDEELLQLVRQGISFSNVPGVSYEYSNLGFALLGKIVSKVSGKPYQQYISETILKPLGMKDTYWEYKKVPANRLAHGYAMQNGAWKDEPLLADGAYGAMGGLLTSIEDFAKYMELHLSAWPVRSGKESIVLKRSSIREMQTSGGNATLNSRFRYPDGKTCPIATQYAFGLGWSRDCTGKIWIGHSGGLPGFGSNWRCYPDYGIGIVCFANATYAATGGINAIVMDTLIKMAGLQPRKLPVSPVLQQRKEQLLKLLPDLTNAAAANIFAENFFSDHPLDSLKKQAATLFANAGKIIQTGPMMPENQLRGIFIIEGEMSAIQVFFTLTPEARPLIQDLELSERKN